MPPTGNLSPGFAPIDEAIKIIKSDTRENPVVDMDYLISHVVWLDRNGPNHNFRIPRIRRLSKDEIYRTRRGKWVEYEYVGDINVFISSMLDKELLKAAIQDKYRELVGHEYQVNIVRGMSTVADDAEGRNAVHPRRNTPLAKEGASIGEGSTATSNGNFAV